MKKIFLPIILILTILMTGCSSHDNISDLMDKTRIDSQKSTEQAQTKEERELIPDVNLSVPPENISDYEKLTYTNYYSVIGKSNFKLNAPAVGTVTYTNLDSLNRPTGVIANINYDLVESERQQKREPINFDPPGFINNQKVVINDEGYTYRGFFYNRSHLLADSLGGEAIPENMVTGTRMQNVGMRNKGGMVFTETQARDYFKNPTQNTMLYEAIPIYNGNELVPRFVIVNVKTSDGVIDEQVIVRNTAAGFTIDYSTGNWKQN